MPFVEMDPRQNLEDDENAGRLRKPLFRCTICEAVCFKKQMVEHVCNIITTADRAILRVPSAYHVLRV